MFASGAALGAGWLETPSVQVVVEGNGELATRLLATGRRAWHPRLAVFHHSPPPPFPLPSEGLPPPPGTVQDRALVCFEEHCAPPVTEPMELADLLRRGPSAPG